MNEENKGFDYLLDANKVVDTYRTNISGEITLLQERGARLFYKGGIVGRMDSATKGALEKFLTDIERMNELAIVERDPDRLLAMYHRTQYFSQKYAALINAAANAHDVISEVETDEAISPGVPLDTYQGASLRLANSSFSINQRDLGVLAAEAEVFFEDPDKDIEQIIKTGYAGPVEY